MATMGQSKYFGLPGYRQQPFFAQDGTNKNLKIQVKSLKHRCLIEVSVVTFHRMRLHNSAVSEQNPPLDYN